MSGENKNKYIKGNSLFGKSCNYCSTYGITCGGGQSLFNSTAFGEIQVELDALGSFNVAGKLEDCKIAAGEVSRKTGTEQIKNLATKKRQEYIDDAVEAAKAELEEETLDISSDNWR